MLQRFLLPSTNLWRVFLLFCRIYISISIKNKCDGGLGAWTSDCQKHRGASRRNNSREIQERNIVLCYLTALYDVTNLSKVDKWL